LGYKQQPRSPWLDAQTLPVRNGSRSRRAGLGRCCSRIA